MAEPELKTQADVEAYARITALQRVLQNRAAWASIVPRDVSANGLPSDITQVPYAISEIRRRRALEQAAIHRPQPQIKRGRRK